MMDPLRFLLGLFFGLLILVGLIGNLMVCIGVYKSRTLRKKRYCYFVSLAMADLILCMLVMPFAAVQDLNGEWLFGRIYCEMWYTLDIMSCSASIFHLCAISIDRYFFIHDPLRYRAKNTIKKVVLIILGLWLTSLAVAATVLGMPTKRVTHSTDLNRTSQKMTHESYSEEALCGFSLDPAFAIILSSISFFIPCLVMIAIYRQMYVCARNHSRVIGHELKTAAEFLLFVAMHRQNKSLNKTRPLEKKRANSRLTVLLNRLNKNRQKRKSRQVSVRKARVTLGVTMGMFIFSWLGYFLCTVVKSFWPSLVPEWLFTALTWLGYANSAQNPIIYSIFNKDFRRAFSRMIWGRKQRPSLTNTFSMSFNHQVVPL